MADKSVAKVIQLFPAPEPKPSAQIIKFPRSAVFRPVRKRVQPGQKDRPMTEQEREQRRLAELIYQCRQREGMPMMSIDEIDKAIAL